MRTWWRSHPSTYVGANTIHYPLLGVVKTLREAPFNLSPPLCGHCPNSNYAPPALKRAPWGTFFQARFYLFTIFTIFLTIFLPFSLNKCPKPSGQGFRPPQNQANAHLNLENSSLKKCPKPSGQGFRPPPPNGQCPHGGGDKLKGASLTQLMLLSLVTLLTFINQWSQVSLVTHCIALKVFSVLLSLDK